MSGSRPERVLDPICSMTVTVADAEGAGLTTEYEGRTYAFCRSGCQRAFAEQPATYAAVAEPVGATTASNMQALPVIDEGMRRWYESWSCCLSDAYPDIKAALDAERAASRQPAADPGLCEVAEGAG